jgi:hypothetical protein
MTLALIVGQIMWGSQAQLSAVKKTCVVNAHLSEVNAHLFCPAGHGTGTGAAEHQRGTGNIQQQQQQQSLPAGELVWMKLFAGTCWIMTLATSSEGLHRMVKPRLLAERRWGWLHQRASAALCIAYFEPGIATDTSHITS